MKAIVSSLIVSGLMAVSAMSIFAQGSLTPPGAPAPTFKTLQQIEPRIDLQNAPASAVDTSNASYHFIINQPGSYYLSANLGVTKTNGIQVNAEGVTLDVNGFQISRASGTGGNGIEIPATANRACVRNGSIKGFAYGIRSLFSSDYARGCAFRDLGVSGCTTDGILAGTGAVLESCRVHDDSGAAAIYAYLSATLSNCVASNNTTTQAIYAGAGSTLNNCATNYNTSTYGIFASFGCALNNCAANNNIGTYGIFAVAGSTLNNCSARANASAVTESAGIGTSGGSTVFHCTSEANTSSATASPTAGMGFEIGAESTIKNCTADSNRGDGINIDNDTVAGENTCSSNGSSGDGAGIHATSLGNRIEANNVTANDRGIDVDSAGNVIIRNTAGKNTNNYDIVAGNHYGPIVDDTDETAVAAPAATGNSATGDINTNHPWANIAY